MTISIGMILPTIAQNVPNYVPTSGLVGWWPFNGNANDESGNGNNGTVNGATLTSDRSEKNNNAYYFNGSNANIVINNTFDFSTKTINVWMQPQLIDGTARLILSIDNPNLKNGANVFRVEQISNTNKIGVTGAKLAGSFIDTVASLNKWQMLTMVKNSSNTFFYFNGVYVGSITSGVYHSNNGANNTILGSDRTSLEYWFNGKIDDLGIWNRELTQQEIKDLYKSCLNPTAIITPQGNTTFCQNGFVNLNASTGTNYTYQWYNNNQVINGATTYTYQASSSGNYAVNVIDGNCNATSAVTTVTVNNNPTVTLNSLDQFTLKTQNSIQLIGNPTGGTFIGDGVNGSTFNPKNAKLGLKTITYNYTTPQGCSGSASRNTILVDSVGNVCNVTNTITKYDTIKTTITKYDTVKVNKTIYDTVKVTSNVTKYDTVNVLKIKVQLTTGVSANQYTSLSVYPNPTSDVLIIDAVDVQALSNYRYRILDLQGKEVYNSLVTNSKTEISLKTIGAKGTYILHVVDGNGNSIKENKIVLE